MTDFGDLVIIFCYMDVILLFHVCLTPVTSEQHSHVDPAVSKKNVFRRGWGSTIASISAATQWHRKWTLWDGI